jgi:hypothetical protein
MANGTCDLQLNTDVSLFFSAIEILTDFSLSLLPAVLLWNVQMASNGITEVTYDTDFATERKGEGVSCGHACSCLIVSIREYFTSCVTGH